MNEPIKACYRFTVDELIEAAKWHFRHNIGPIFRYVIIAFLGALMIAGISEPILRGFSFHNAQLLALVIMAILFFYFFPKWLLRQNFKKRPDRDMQVEWQISSDKILTKTELGHSEFTWQTISKVVQTPRGFLFYTVPQIFHWLPRHGFANEADVERLAELAKTHAAKFCRAR